MIRHPLALTLICCFALSPAAYANGWNKLRTQPVGKASTMFLLMDGRVLMNEEASDHWWILTPAADGSYLDGAWSAAADSRYDRQYFASGVLADGRVIVAGGAYSTSGGSNKVETYDPVTNQWTTITSPAGWSTIGAVPSVVLADGRFMIGNQFDARTAIWDPATASWSAAASKQNSRSLGESWVLLADGTVVSADCIGHPGSQLYDPATDTWVALGNLPVDLVDASYEIGPGLLMNDGRAVFVGATPHSAHYSAAAVPGGVGTWVQGGDPPPVGTKVVSAKDAPACILPGGNVLCALGVGFLAPTYFFEYDGASFNRVSDPANNNVPAYAGRLLLLPSGEILYAAGTVYLYSPNGDPDPAWRPTISAVATDLIPGETYILTGTQLNGRTQACSYGDGGGVATNYPIVRLIYPATGNTIYCRSFDPSTMAVATGSTPVSTHFVVPATAATGEAKLEVIANGIASDGVSVVVRDPIMIGFDLLANRTPVTTQFPEATFSSTTGFENRAVARSSAASPPNALCTGPVGGAVDCMHDTDVDFRCPVASLTFRGTSISGTGTVATVNVFEDGVLTGAVSVTGNGNAGVPVRVDLTSFHDVTRIEIVAISDAGGIAWDDFKFCLSSSASWRNYGAGFPGTLGEPTLTMEADPVIGTSTFADLSNSSPSVTVALVLVGDLPVSIPSNRGGTFLLLPTYSLFLSIDPGVTMIDVDIADDPALCGVEVYGQALVIDAGAAKGVSFTAGIKLVVGY